MRKLILVALAALALPATAAAGGWATAGISPVPDDAATGTEETFTITVLRHGRTPEDGAKPMIVLTNSQSGETKTFAATPAGKTGSYEATVTWPEGSWAFAVNDGLEATGYGISQTHTFGTVSIGGGGATAPAAGGGSADTVWTIVGGVALGLALAALLVLGLRRRPRGTAPATAPH